MVNWTKKWLNELEKRNIKLKNYREDKIPFNLVQKIITEKDEDLLNECNSKENFGELSTCET